MHSSKIVTFVESSKSTRYFRANDRNGHSQPSATLDIYTHAFDKNKKAASQIMQSSLEI